MPFSVFTESHYIKETVAFFKSVGWSWLLATPLFLMHVGAPIVEKRHTISKFLIQVLAAITVTLVCSAFVFYVGTTAFTTKMTVEIKFIKDSLASIETTLSKQDDINNKTDIDFLTHKHSKKDGAVKLRGEH